MNYVDSSPGTPSLNSMSIDPLEARSLLFFISQRSGKDVKLQPYNSTGVWYLFLIEISGRYYGINIIFSNVKPSLDSGGVGIGSTHARGIVSLTWGDITNRTSALNQGIHGYVLARLTEPNDPLVIHVNGTTKATVELWFVSYDWPEVKATNVTVSPQVSYGGGDWYNFTALSEPNGNMTLRVNEPTVINVTLSVPKGGSTGVGLGGNYRATLVDVKSTMGFLDSSCNIYEGKPILSVQASNVTDEDSKIKIFNPGPGNVEFGLQFNTEKMVNGSWTPVEDHTIWILPLIMMGAGSDWSQRMNTTGLDSRLYRISKEITYNGQKQTFYAEFNFTRPA